VFGGRGEEGHQSILYRRAARSRLAAISRSLRPITAATPSRTQRSSFERFIADYLTKRETLYNIFVLLDARLEPQKIDLEFMNWCGQKGLPFSMVFTKIDKLSSSALQKNLAKYKKEMLKVWAELPPVFTTSAQSGFGKEPLLNYIDQILA
jgi:GTP-binding protein